MSNPILWTSVLSAALVLYMAQDPNFFEWIHLRSLQAEIWIRRRYLMMILHPKSPIGNFLQWRRHRQILRMLQEKDKNEQSVN